MISVLLNVKGSSRVLLMLLVAPAHAMSWGSPYLDHLFMILFYAFNIIALLSAMSFIFSSSMWPLLWSFFLTQNHS